jgi:hypothetical protein
MRNLTFIVMSAVIASVNLTAQNSRIISVNGNEKKVETTFLNKTSGIETPDFITQDGKVIRLNPDNSVEIFEKEFSGKTAIQATPYDKERPLVSQDGKTVRQDFRYPIPDTPLQEMVSSRKATNFEPSLSVKKSARDDVATITFEVIGYPLIGGFHLLLDADAQMSDYYYYENYLVDCSLLY